MLARLCLPLLLGLTAFSPSALAAGLPVPSVEYSADRVVETDAGTFTGKVYVAHDKQRTEMSVGGMQSVMILRRDKHVGWMLMPAHHMYQELDYAQAQKRSGAQGQDAVDITKVGAETIDGHATTKYKMLMKDGSGGGFIWLTAEGIPLKMDLLQKSGGEKTRTTMTLRNLHIGAQDPKLFEIPEGYTAIPTMKGMGGLGAFTKGALSRLPGRHKPH